MFKALTTLVLFSVLCSCASANHREKRVGELDGIESGDPLSKDTFSFHEPTANDLSTKLTLWGTYYYLPQLNDGSGNYAIRDMNGSELGPKLSLKDWCNSALEGSVRIIDKNVDAKT